MRLADITDNWGSWLRVDQIPGTDLDDPVLYTVTVKDHAIAAVTLNYEQARDLAYGLLDKLGMDF